MGRPNLPTGIKKMKGTLRPDRSNPEEPEVSYEEIPAPPDGLTEMEVKFWDRLKPAVDIMSVAGKPDVEGFEMMVRQRAAYEVAMQQDPRDYKLILALSKDIAGWFSKFGLTPQSRAAIRKINKAKNVEEALSFLELN